MAFLKLLDKANKKINKAIRQAKEKPPGHRVIAGDVMFTLYSTNGVPVEVVEDMASA